MAAESIDKVGERIKQLRKTQQMTLQRLSEYTGLSIGFLSSVERDITSPSLQNLKQIAEALDTTISDLISITKPERVVVRKNETKIIEFPQCNQTITYIDFGFSPSLYEIIVIHPGKPVECLEARHIYDECCIVISGQLTLEIDDITYILKKGESAYIKKNTKHRIYNQTKQPCISYWNYMRT